METSVATHEAAAAPRYGICDCSVLRGAGSAFFNPGYALPKCPSLLRWQDKILHGFRGEGEKRAEGFAALIVAGTAEFVSRKAGDNALGLPLRLIASIEWKPDTAVAAWDRSPYQQHLALLRLWCKNEQLRDELEKQAKHKFQAKTGFAKDCEPLRRGWMEFGTELPIAEHLRKIEMWLRDTQHTTTRARVLAYYGRLSAPTGRAL